MKEDALLQELKARKQVALAEAYATVCNSNDLARLNFIDGTNQMAVFAKEIREQSKFEKAIKSAGLPHSRANQRDIDYTYPRHLEYESFSQQFQLYWVRDQANIIITGSSQIGKNWLASALAVEAIMKGFKVKAYRIDKFLSDINDARSRLAKNGKPEIVRLENELEKLDVLYLHGLGACELEDSQLRDLEDVVRLLHGETSFLITSPVASHTWNEYFEYTYLGDSIINRLLGRGIVFDLAGDPYTRVPKQKTGNGELS